VSQRQQTRRRSNIAFIDERGDIAGLSGDDF
jgi:hypothetical protein